MSEPVSVFSQPPTSESSPENQHIAVDQPLTTADGRKRKHHTQQTRQLLSCTKCRERKVKVRLSQTLECDRTKPCSACCARGIPRDCKFVVGEGNDFSPIAQSIELKKLRAENVRLKERLRASKLTTEDDDAEQRASPDHRDGASNQPNRRKPARQKRFHGHDWSDNIYFGTPGLANVLKELANLRIDDKNTPQPLSHVMPRREDIFAPGDPSMYPFATLWNAASTGAEALPEQDELFGYLDFFDKRAQTCVFPYTPNEISRVEVKKFLSEKEKNAETHPDMLALLFAALALGSQHSVWDKCGEKWEKETMDEEAKKGDVYIAAAMQALRKASFMNKPSLLGIQALIMIGPYLTNSGRFHDAWTLFGTTIRLAHSIGLHRNPLLLNPTPRTQTECSVRQTLWWWMLHMDQQYSMTLGRPLGISGIGDCPPPIELTTNTTSLRFQEYTQHFTILAREILGSDRLSHAKIDDFTDALEKLLDTVPETLRFDENWLEAEDIPESPFSFLSAIFYSNTYNYILLLNRQRFDKPTHAYTSSTPLSVGRTSPPSFVPVNVIPTQPSTVASSRDCLRGHPRVLAAALNILTAFHFLYTRVPAAMICWTIGQQAYNACMMLLLDALDSGDMSRIRKVEQAYAVFAALKGQGVHRLAELAVERISWGLEELINRPKISAGSRIQMEPGGPRGVEPWGNRDITMQGTGSEAPQGFDTPCGPDLSVMGNTGMMMLEDPGLQSYVPESFGPLTWSMAGSPISGLAPMQRKAQEQGQGNQGERDANPDNNGGSGCLEEEFQGLEDARSSEEVQGVHGSTQGSTQGSAPPRRYATFCTAPSRAQGQGQPQGLLSPTSPPSPTSLLQQLQQQQQGLHVSPPPPQLRHHSFPSLQQNVPAPLAPHPPYLHQHDTNAPPVFTMPFPQRQIPIQAHAQSAPTGTPFFSPTSVSTSTQPHIAFRDISNVDLSQTSNPSANPWAARPAAPISSASAPVIPLPHLQDVTPPFAIGHVATQSYAQGYSFPMATMPTSSNATAVKHIGATADAELDEDWRQLFASSHTSNAG